MADNDPLRDLGQRIQSAKQSYEVEPKVEDHHSGLQHAWFGVATCLEDGN